MIVFWRMFLAMFMADTLLFHKMLKMQEENRLKATLVRTGFFVVSSFALCWNYLTVEWPFLGFWHISGWFCILLMSILYAGIHQFFDFGGKMKHGHLLTFFVKMSYIFLVLFLCAPLRVLYETGHFFAQPGMIFLVGLVLVTRVLEWFITSVEQDSFGRMVRTFDEQWLMMMVRAICYLIMLLPGVRWLILFVIWFLTCLYARHIRLMDVSRVAFYGGIFGSALIGLLARFRIYWG